MAVINQIQFIGTVRLSTALSLPSNASEVVNIFMEFSYYQPTLIYLSVAF